MSANSKPVEFAPLVTIEAELRPPAPDSKPRGCPGAKNTALPGREGRWGDSHEGGHVDLAGAGDIDDDSGVQAQGVEVAEQGRDSLGCVLAVLDLGDGRLRDAQALGAFALGDTECLVR